MGLLRPLPKPYGVRCEDGFIDMAVALVGTIQLWDDIQQNFDLNLCRRPDYGERIVDDLYGLLVYAPGGDIVVYYHVDDGAQMIELVEVHRV